MSNDKKYFANEREELEKYEKEHGADPDGMYRYGFCDKCMHISFIDKMGGGPFKPVLFECPLKNSECTVPFKKHD